MPDGRSRKNEALGRVGISNPALLSGLPRITHILAKAEKGLAQVLEALRASNDPDAQAFVSKYDSLAAFDHQLVGWEEIAFAAGIPSYRLLEISVSALLQQFGTVGQIIAATSHPLVVEATVRRALTEKGTREREMLLQAQGFLPTPKGSVIIGRVQIANLSGSPEPSEPETTDYADLPSMEDDLRGIHDMMLGEGKLLKD